MDTYIIPQFYILAIKKPPIKGAASTYEGYSQNQYYYTKIKKPQHNAEASTTTAMVSLLQSEGR